MAEKPLHLPPVTFEQDGTVSSDEFIRQLIPLSREKKLHPKFILGTLIEALMRSTGERDPKTLEEQANQFIIQSSQGVGIRIQQADEENAIRKLMESSRGGRR